jgi:hypothetical protein
MDDHGGHPPFRAACVGSVELSTGKTPSARHVGGRQRLEHPENQCVRNVPYIAGMFLPRSADICRYLPISAGQGCVAGSKSLRNCVFPSPTLP